MLSISVAGAGLIGSRHVELVDRSAECRLASIADPAPAAQALAARYQVPWDPSVPALLERERPDGIIVATPSQLHLEHALACIDAGVPNLLEKPIATTVEDGVAIATAAADRDAPLLVGHHRRHSPIIRAARRVIESGVLGRLVAVTGAATFRKPDTYFDEAPWRREVGGGPILINLIHEIDNLRFLCGEISSVQAQASSVTRGFGVEDSVAITFAFTNGALGTFMLSDVAASPVSWELTAGENPDYPNVPGVDCYLLAGDRGSLGVPTLRLASYPGTPSWWEPLLAEIVDVRRTDPLEEQIAHFCAVIRRETEPLVTGWEGVQNLVVAKAVAEAARTGCTVRTPDVRTIAPGPT